MSTLEMGFLRELEIVIFKRVASGNYQLHSLVPDSYNRIFPLEPDGSPCRQPWLHSPMLEFFINEAENFFSSQQTGKIESGIWLEAIQGQPDMPMTAIARFVNNEPIVYMQCIREHYEERTRILQQARAELLEVNRLNEALISYKRKSLYDALTHLYNRGAFEDFLNIQLSDRRNTSQDNLALLMLDIDHFKNVNDSYGHLVGDSVLTQLGAILIESLRREDVPARYGGEEFVILAPKTTLEQAGMVAEKLRGNVEAFDFKAGPAGHPLTISVGLTVYQHGESSHRFIKRADDALYVAKQTGRNRIYVIEPPHE